MKRQETIFLVAGGTGGHVFPAMALAAQLRKRGFSVILLTDGRVEKFIKVEDFDAIHTIKGATIYGKNPLHWVKSFFQLTCGFITSYRYLRRYKPIVVVGFGGYPTVAPLCAAVLQGRRIIIHEQNAVMGRANRFLSALAHVIALGFAPKKMAYPKKTFIVGTPVRDSVLNILPAPYRPSKEEEDFYLLVFGGSQGAAFFSQILPQALLCLPERFRKRLVLIQQARAEEQAVLEKKYQELGVRFEIAAFFEDLPERIKKAHFVIARAGASTVVELSLIGRPSLLIPYPYALDHDQACNAEAVAGGHGFQVIVQKDLTPSRLANLLEDVISTPDHLSMLAEQMQKKSSTPMLVDFEELVLQQCAVALKEV